MSSTPHRPDHPRPAPSASVGAVLTGVLGGPIAWAVHLLLSYFLVALACATGWRGAAVGLAVATVILAAAAVGSGALAYRHWRDIEHPGESSARFLWLIGMILAALFAVVIVLAGLPPLFTPMCA